MFGCSYSIVTDEEELTVLEAAQRVNGFLPTNKNSILAKKHDEQNTLALVALQIAIELVKQERSAKVAQEKIGNLEKTLSCLI